MANIYGSLIAADLENQSSDPSTPTNGRIYLNTTSHIAKFRANSGWHTIMDLDTAQTATNKTFTSPVLDGSLTGTGIKDEDDMASDSATAVPTQQSVKAYVDTEIASVLAGGEDVHTVTNDNYVVLDGDNYTTFLFSTGGSNRTLTLPTAADNTNRVIRVKKIDSGSGRVTVDGENTETVEGAADIRLFAQNDGVTLQCNGTTWYVVASFRPPNSQVVLDTGNGHGSTNTHIRRFTNSSVVGAGISYADSATLGASLTITENGVYSMHWTDGDGSAGQLGFSINASGADLTTSINSITAANRIISVQSPANIDTMCSATVRLVSGDVIRPHDNSALSLTNARCKLIITQLFRFFN